MEIKNAAELTKPSALRIIYGNPGLGKTTTIKYMPGLTLLIDIDGTSSVLKGCSNIDITTLPDKENPRESLPKLLKDIKDNYIDKYDNIVLDNISELENAVLTEYGKKGNNHGVPGIQNYQQLQFFELDTIRYLKSMNKNVLITAWEMTDEYTAENGQSFTRAYPQIRKPILTNVMGLALQVGRLTISPKSGERGFQLMPTDSVFAKNQLDSRKGCLQADLFNEGDENNGVRSANDEGTKNSGIQIKE